MTEQLQILVVRSDNQMMSDLKIITSITNMPRGHNIIIVYSIGLFMCPPQVWACTTIIQSAAIM